MHFHVYKWIGGGSERQKSAPRTPYLRQAPGEARVVQGEFASSRIPPEVVWHNLLRPRTAIDSTIRTPDEARKLVAAFLVETPRPQYSNSGPDGQWGMVSPTSDTDHLVDGAGRAVERGAHTVVGYYIGSRADTFASLSLVACPHPDCPCPAGMSD